MALIFLSCIMRFVVCHESHHSHTLYTPLSPHLAEVDLVVVGWAVRAACCVDAVMDAITRVVHVQLTMDPAEWTHVLVQGREK